MQTAVMLVAVGILSIIAYADIRTRRISNVLTGALAILSLIRIILFHEPGRSWVYPCGRHGNVR
jgi:Flp pilus assembly protein protease CpaA